MLRKNVFICHCYHRCRLQGGTCNSSSPPAISAFRRGTIRIPDANKLGHPPPKVFDRKFLKFMSKMCNPKPFVPFSYELLCNCFERILSLGDLYAANVSCSELLIGWIFSCINLMLTEFCRWKPRVPLIMNRRVHISHGRRLYPLSALSVTYLT